MKALGVGIPALTAAPFLNVARAPERGKVKITDVKVMRVQFGRNHVMPLVKIETDAGVYGIGECHHDVTGLGANDTVLNCRFKAGSRPRRRGLDVVKDTAMKQMLPGETWWGWLSIARCD